MRYKIHYKTGDFCFIEYETENRDDAVQEYYVIKAMFEDKEGLQDKEWNALTDKYLTTNTMKAEEYESLSREQKNYIQWVKRAFKRLEVNNK